MRKIIEGHLYNTETARKVGAWGNNVSGSDFSSVDETLYRTKSGKYFLYGSGGPMTKYSISCGNNSWSGGSHIEPMSPAAAAIWAEEHLSVEKYSAEFGEPEEASDGREQLNLSVSSDIKRKLEKMRGADGKSISQIISDIVNGL